VRENANKEWIFERLKHSLQALSLSAGEQRRLFPDFVVKTDELVLDFYHWRECVVTNYAPQVSREQMATLVALDEKTQAATNGDRNVWDENAIVDHPFWAELRKLARESLEAFNWPETVPPSHADEYIRGKTRGE
jgi:hypothetical protein